MLPLAVALGDADEVGAEEHALDAVDLEQTRGERRILALVGIGEFERALVEHRPPRNEFQGGGVRRRFGLDEHGAALGISGESLGILTREARRKSRPASLEWF